MWKAVLSRAGRVVVAVVSSGVVQYATGSPYAVVLTPMISALGKWLRMRGFQNIPF